MSGKSPCAIPIIVTVLIMIFLIVVAVLLAVVITINRTKSKFKDNYSTGIIEYCESVQNVAYTGPIIYPENRKLYNKELAQNLYTTCLNTTASNCYNNFDIPMPIGYNRKVRLIGKNPVTQKPQMFAIVFTNENMNKMLVSFTATFWLDSWLIDASFGQVPPNVLNGYQRGQMVHKGFYNTYLEVRNEVWKMFNAGNFDELIITGHSLGGALSSICAFDFYKQNPILYTFGSPRVFNNTMALAMEQYLPDGKFRIANVQDTVTTVPFPTLLKTNYTHIDQLISLNVNLGTLSGNHVIAYKEFMPESQI